MGPRGLVVVCAAKQHAWSPRSQCRGGPFHVWPLRKHCRQLARPAVRSPSVAAAKCYWRVTCSAGYTLTYALVCYVLQRKKSVAFLTPARETRDCTRRMRHHQRSASPEAPTDWARII